MAGLLASLGSVDMFSDAHDDITAAVFADTKQLAFDGEGRIMLPEALTRHAGITDVAAFVGPARPSRSGTVALRDLQGRSSQARLEKGRTLRQAPTGETGGK